MKDLTTKLLSNFRLLLKEQGYNTAEIETILENIANKNGLDGIGDLFSAWKFDYTEDLYYIVNLKNCINKLRKEKNLKLKEIMDEVNKLYGTSFRYYQMKNFVAKGNKKKTAFAYIYIPFYNFCKLYGYELNKEEDFKLGIKKNEVYDDTLATRLERLLNESGKGIQEIINEIYEISNIKIDKYYFNRVVSEKRVKFRNITYNAIIKYLNSIKF